MSRNSPRPPKRGERVRTDERSTTIASRVYDELYAEYGRMPTEEEVLFRLERRVGRDRATTSVEARNSESEQNSLIGPKMRPPPRVSGGRPGA